MVTDATVLEFRSRVQVPVEAPSPDPMSSQAPRQAWITEPAVPLAVSVTTVPSGNESGPQMLVVLPQSKPEPVMAPVPPRT